MYTRTLRIAAALAAGSLLTAGSALASQNETQGQGQAIVTILPDHDNQASPVVQQQGMTAKVNGKQVNISNWQQLSRTDSSIEMVILIDGAARSSLGTQTADIDRFVQTLPANARVAIAYMQNGRALMTSPLSSDRAAVLRGLHLTGGGIPGVSASPYFCLSDLAKHWPSNDRQARREVVMVTDGVDYYNMRYDPEDPYVKAAIEDSARAQLVVYSIYWRNVGRVDRSEYATDAGQNLLMEVTQATGGNSYWQGYGNPVSFQPYFADIDRRLGNQYELSFEAPYSGKSEVESLRLKISAPGAKVTAPEQIFVSRPAVNGGE